MAIRVHSSALYDELLVEEVQPVFSRPTLRGPSQSLSSVGTSQRSMDLKSELERAQKEAIKVQREKMANKHKVRREQMQREVEAAQKRAQDKKEAEFRFHLKRIADGDSLRERVDKDMYLRDRERFERKKTLYKDWERNVYRPIQKALNKTVQTHSQTGIGLQRKHFETYLEQASKRQIFQSQYDSDYDPFLLTKSRPKASTHRLDDPLKASLKRNEREGNLRDSLDPAKAMPASASTPTIRSAGQSTLLTRPSTTHLPSMTRPNARKKRMTLVERQREAGLARRQARGRNGTDSWFNLEKALEETGSLDDDDGSDNDLPAPAVYNKVLTMGKATLPPKWWGSGKIDHLSAVHVKAAKSTEGLVDRYEPEMIEMGQKLYQKYATNRDKLFGDHYSRPTKEEVKHMFHEHFPSTSIRTNYPKKDTPDILGKHHFTPRSPRSDDQTKMVQLLLFRSPSLPRVTCVPSRSQQNLH